MTRGAVPMAVEILILSGTRHNDQITLDGRQFRVGADPDCEVFLDPQRDGAIRGRSAQFRLQEDGWYVRCAGGEMSINGRRVVGATHVRSGDVVRMSESGPEFSFRIVAGARPSPVKAPAAQTVSPLPLEEVPEVQVAPQAASPLPVGEGPGVSVSRIVPPSADNFLADSPHLPRLPAKDRQWAIWAVGGLAVGILALIAIRFTLSPSTIIVNVGQPVAAAPLAASPVINSSSGKADREVAKGGHVSAPKKKTSVVTDKPKEPGEEDKPEGRSPRPPRRGRVFNPGGEVRSLLALCHLRGRRRRYSC